MKILLVDDHPLIRRGIEEVTKTLDRTVTVVHAPDCERAFALLDKEQDVDLILLDIALPGMSGMEGLAICRQRYPRVPVVVLSAFADRDLVIKALDRGAMGVIPKTAEDYVVEIGLKLVVAGEPFVPLSMLRTSDGAAIGSELPTTSQLAPRAPRKPSDLGLTGQEAVILAHLIQGRQNKLIAAELAIEETTVRKHVSAILRKLGVRNRTQAVMAAVRLGLTIRPVL